MEITDAAFAQIRLEVKVDVFKHPDSQCVKEVRQFPLRMFTEEQGSALTEMLDRAAERVQNAWQEEPFDADSVSSEPSRETSSFSPSMSDAEPNDDEDLPIG